jgi:alanine dehydrogenase
LTCVSVPTETKADEHRVALTPAGARELVDAGHEVVVQAGAGRGAGFTDDEFEAAGARLAANAEEAFRLGDLILKVKEPQPPEVPLLEPRHILFTYLHLAANPELACALADTGATCVAYEMVSDDRGGLPLLAPMSEIAGRIAAQALASCLEYHNAGRGVLMAGAPGVEPARIAIIGGGVVGLNAALIAVGMRADVLVLDRSVERLRFLDATYGDLFETRYATALAIDELLPEADGIVGAVLIPGARAPKVIRAEQLPHMRDGAVLVDVAIDQGGLLRDLTTHNPPATHLQHRRHRSLLRREHARRRPAHSHDRPNQRHAPVCAGPRRKRAHCTLARRLPPCGRGDCCRPPHLRTCRRGRGSSLRPRIGRAHDDSPVRHLTPGDDEPPSPPTWPSMIGVP